MSQHDSSGNHWRAKEGGTLSDSCPAFLCLELGEARVYLLMIVNLPMDASAKSQVSQVNGGENREEGSKS